MIKVADLRDIITTVTIEYSTWNIKPTDVLGFFENLEHRLRNCMREPRSSTNQILKLSATDNREACTISLLWNSLIKINTTGPRLRDNNDIAERKPGELGILFFQFEENIQLQDTRFFPIKFQSSTTTMWLISCGKQMMTTLQFSELFNVFEMYIYLGSSLLLSTNLSYH